MNPAKYHVPGIAPGSKSKTPILRNTRQSEMTFLKARTQLSELKIILRHVDGKFAVRAHGSSLEFFSNDLEGALDAGWQLYALRSAGRSITI
jgi:hypothetical protein